MRFLRSKITLAVSLVIISAFGFLVVKAYAKDRALRADMGSLEMRIGEAEQKNRELADVIAYFSDPRTVEKEAKVRFNLKRPGEEVLVLRRTAPSQSTTSNLPQVIVKRQGFGFPSIADWFKNIFGIDKKSK